MKTNPTQPILEARETLLITQKKLENCRGLLENNKPLLEDAVVNADITTLEGLQKISTLQTLDYALPLRIAALERREASEEAALISTVNTCIETAIAPLARGLQSMASAKVREELKPHFPNAALLEQRVLQSEMVNRFSALIPSISNNPYGGALAFAQTALDAWNTLAELEAKKAQA